MAGRDSLGVDLSRERLHAIETAESFATEGSFVVAVTNHGRDAHVHVKLEDDLARAASTGDANYYVGRDETVEIEVSVDPAATPASGQLTVESGYGAEAASVDVRVAEPPDAGVRVDERLNEPPPAEPEGSDRELLPVALLAVGAMAVAAVTAVFVDDPVVLVGVAAVLAGVVVAAVLVLR